jgi:hypothetical protein
MRGRYYKALLNHKLHFAKNALVHSTLRLVYIGDVFKAITAATATHNSIEI